VALAPRLDFDAVPTFSIFRDLIRQNIGHFPDFSCDSVTLSGHRIRVFYDPPSAEILLSERALARYLRVADILVAALQRKNAEFIANCLCIEAGGEFLISNRFQGLALIAHGFKSVHVRRLSVRKGLESATTAAQDPNEVLPLISLLLPLAHEIGHLPQAQAFCPKAVMGEEFLETFRVNYEEVKSFTGEFDYATSLADKRSPINLATLRQEIAADYFATCALSTLFAKTNMGQEYPITPLTFGLLLFPIAMAFEDLSLGRGRSPRAIQEASLAMQCRQSVLIDSLRACLKSFFEQRPNRENVFEVIDATINRVHEQLYALQLWMWGGMRSYIELVNKMSSWDFAQVLAYAREATPDVRQQLGVANYISVLLNDLDAYPLSSENEESLRAYTSALMTFDSVVIDGENAVRLIRKAQSPGGIS
jgi:hypothetical protein